MASPIMDGFVLLLLSIIVPLHLLSLRSHFTRKINGGRSGIVRSVLLLASVPVLLSLIFAVSDHKASSSQLEEMKLKIYQLESFLEDNIKALNSKTIRVEDNNKLIEGMEQKIQYLQDAQRNIKASPSGYSKERVDALEEEVRLLWEGSRKNNFNIHVLESKAYDVEEKTQTIASEVEKMNSVVTEQWFQIRQLEQSLQMTKTMASNVHERSATKIRDRNQLTKCTMYKFIRSIRHYYLPELVGLPDSLFLGGSNSNFWICRAFNHFKNILSACKKWHHELQYFVRQEMELNEFTSALANKEVVFLVASAIMLFPVMSAWILCSSCFSDPN